MDRLNILRSDLEPKATENIEAMTSMIETLLQKGFAYKTSSGDIYLDVQKDSNYGSISSKSDDETQSRVEGDPEKKDPRDFALWKRCKDGEDEFCFEAKGVALGRPGWHIECSAMIEKLLDTEDSEYSVDIHGGGADLLFPHHENEASQMRCAHGKEIAKYWMHNGFVNINGEKMAKSLKNSFLIKDALEVVDGEVLRYYLLSTHYRAPLNFNHEDMMSAKKRLDKIYRLKKRVYGVKGKGVDEEFKKHLLEPLSDDLNISVALSVIDEFIKLSNEFLDSKEKNNKRKADIVSNIDFIEKTLGFGGSDAYEYFQRGVSDEEREKIESLIEQRDEAKKAKDYAKADNIRDEIDAMDIAIMDTPEGTVWEKKEKGMQMHKHQERQGREGAPPRSSFATCWKGDNSYGNE
eukprot:TRINITY_DN11164_c0_g1_i1.p3 TRINITY_DN11164_c0_g1~~TRINITY_DN11164_c0_g1_i1.p3  ORF type:complete len:476 (+),score=64.26 TRINITY_DN11164_c0_g1_i1:208-1428(+)